MPQNSRRRRISVVGGRQITVDQRVSDALCLTSIRPRLVRISREPSQLKQAAGSDRCRRSVAIAIYNSLIAEVVPVHAVFRQFGDDVARDFLRGLSEKQRKISQKRKAQYASDAEYREQRKEASRKRRAGELTPPVPADAPISMSEAAKQAGIGYSTLQEWCKRKLYPEPVRHKGGLFFTEHQVCLLAELKDVFRKFKMRPQKIKQQRVGEVCAFISANWHQSCRDVHLPTQGNFVAIACERLRTS